MTDLQLTYPHSSYESSTQTLAQKHCRLVSTLKSKFPGATPRIEHLASVDAVHVSGVSALHPSTLAQLRTFGIIDYQLQDDTLSLYITRKQRSVCAAATVALLYICLGAACLMGAASRMR
jgi:hypothetical protein